MAAKLTVEKIAVKFGYSPHWVRMMAKAGKIPAIKMRKRWFFNEDAVRTALFVPNSYAKPEGHNAGNKTPGSDDL